MPDFLDNVRQKLPGLLSGFYIHGSIALDDVNIHIPCPARFVKMIIAACNRGATNRPEVVAG